MREGRPGPERWVVLLAAVLLAVALGGSTCEEDPCTSTGCPAPRICNRTSGRCELPPTPTCDTVTCRPDEACDPSTGSCVPRTTFCRVDPDQCPANEPCSICAEGLVCDASSGLCVAACRYLTCARNETCDEATNACTPIMCRQDTDCPSGTVCPSQRRCEVGCRSGEDCADNEYCDLADGAVVGNCRSLCSVDTDCPWGSRCEPQAGRSRCAVEAPCTRDSECRVGETCRLSTCQRALCGTDLDCTVGTEYCNADTGECRSAACTVDEFEPNDTRTQAHRILAGAYAGLSLCRGELDDWYELRLAGESPAFRVTVLHDEDVDLDIDVFAGSDPSPLARGRSVGASEQVVVASPSPATLLIHVFAVRGSDLSYQMTIDEDSASCEEDGHEPNDSVTRAALLPTDRPSESVMTCPGNADIFELLPSGDGTSVYIEAEPRGVAPNPSDWVLALSLHDTQPEPIPIEAGGGRRIELAHLSPAARLFVRSTAFTAIPWSLQVTTTQPVCDDPAGAHDSPLTAAVLAMDEDDRLTRSDERLCPAGEPPGFEADWFRLDLPDDQAVELGATLSVAEVGFAGVDALGLRLSLLAGGTPRPWTAAVAGADGEAALRVPLSRVDRPLWLRVDGPAGLPPLLGQWPGYRLQLQTVAMQTCVEELAEGSGNNTLASAGVLAPGTTVDGILCDGDTDAFVIESLEELPQVRLWAEHDVSVFVYEEIESPAVLSVQVVGGQPASDVLQTYQGTSPSGLLWIRLVRSGMVPQGTRFRIVAE